MSKRKRLHTYINVFVGDTPLLKNISRSREIILIDPRCPYNTVWEVSHTAETTRKVKRERLVRVSDSCDGEM